MALLLVHAKPGIGPLNKGDVLVFALNLDFEEQAWLRPLKCGISISSS